MTESQGSNDHVPKISGFVICYNRERLIETCLRSLRFVDELIVVDQGSHDQTRYIAERYADRLYGIPWSPTVEASRAFALSQCTHDTIVFLDDDEVLSTDAIRHIRRRAGDPDFGVMLVPLRHYVLGRHDEAAYYWPERQIRAFRRGCVEFGSKVHAGVVIVDGQIEQVGFDTAVCVHNLSYQNTHEWIEKTNRYTSSRDRAVSPGFTLDEGLQCYAKSRIDHWFDQRKGQDLYLDAVSTLRALYDIVDIVKLLEDSIGVRTGVDFQSLCETFDRDFDELSRDTGITTHPRETVGLVEPVPPAVEHPTDKAGARIDALTALVARLQADVHHKDALLEGYRMRDGELERLRSAV